MDFIFGSLYQTLGVSEEERLIISKCADFPFTDIQNVLVVESNQTCESQFRKTISKQIQVEEEYNNFLARRNPPLFPYCWFVTMCDETIEFKGVELKMKDDLGPFLKRFLGFVFASPILKARNYAELKWEISLFYIPTYDAMLAGFLKARTIGGRPLGGVNKGEDEESRKKIRL